MNVQLALTCALPEGRLRAGGRMRTGSEPWCKGLTFSRDRPLLRVRLLTSPDRLGPAYRAADAQQATFPSVAHVERLPCPRRVRSRAETQAMTAGRRTLRAIVSSVLSRIAVLFLESLVLALLWRSGIHYRHTSPPAR